MRNSATRGAGSRLLPGLAATAAFACAAALAASAQATTVHDPVGDRLPTFTNNPDPTPDLDVVSATAVYNAHQLILSATMAGNIGTSDAGEYVWGINRGAGSPLLSEPNPLTDTSTPIGGNIPFDAFIILGNGVVSDEHDVNSGGFGVLLGSYNGANVGHEISPTGSFGIDPSLVTISGRTITLCGLVTAPRAAETAWSRTLPPTTGTSRPARRLSPPLGPS
jgi:hypothetical protein